MNCWHCNIYEQDKLHGLLAVKQDKFHPQLSWVQVTLSIFIYFAPCVLILYR